MTTRCALSAMHRLSTSWQAISAEAARDLIEARSSWMMLRRTCESVVSSRPVVALAASGILHIPIAKSRKIRLQVLWQRRM